jgi:hypothetical protein
MVGCEPAAVDGNVEDADGTVGIHDGADEQVCMIEDVK